MGFWIFGVGGRWETFLYLGLGGRRFVFVYMLCT